MPSLASSRTALLMAMIVVAPTVATARERGPAPGAYVVAESRWGNGTVSGPVRPSRTGAEVRLPGGTWVACGRSCAETLRQETVDFWEARGPLDDRGPGYFKFRFGW